MSQLRFPYRQTKTGWVTSVVIAGMGVTFATLLFWLIRGILGKGHAALLYLPVVVLVGSLGGARAGILAALLAFVAWNFFFISPYYTFVIHDSKDWISLVAFLAVGSAMGIQTGRLRERERTAREHEEEASLLYRLSAQLTAQTETRVLIETLLDEIRQTFNSDRALLFLPGTTNRLVPHAGHGQWEADLNERLQPLAEWSFRQVKALGLPPISTSEKRGVKEPFEVSTTERQASLQSDNGVFLPLHATRQVEGVLYVSSKPPPRDYTPRDARLLVSIGQLTAALLERQRLQKETTELAALREADRLKSTLVSSVSHELKTPLASISATVSNLLEDDVEWNPETLREELRSVDRDLTRLNDSIGQLLDLSRLEAGAWEPKRDAYELGEILGAVLSRFDPPERERIAFDLSEDLPPLFADFQQIEKVLHNLIENALNYSQTARLVRIGAAVHTHTFNIWVEDEGPGIPERDRERIFEKFYRGTASTRAPSGIGLGLAIVREIIRFHGGQIWVEERHPFGSRFVVALPREISGVLKTTTTPGPFASQ